MELAYIPESGQLPFPSDSELEYDAGLLPPLYEGDGEAIFLNLDEPRPAVQMFPAAPQMSPLQPPRHFRSTRVQSFKTTSFQTSRDRQGMIVVNGQSKHEIPLPEPRSKRTKIDDSRFFHSITGKQLIDPIKTTCSHYFNAGEAQQGKPCPKCKQLVVSIIVNPEDRIFCICLDELKLDL